MHRILVLTLVLGLGAFAHSGEKAINAFNGKDLTGWKVPKNNQWKVGAASLDDKGKVLAYAGGSGEVEAARGGNTDTGQEFGDCLIEGQVIASKTGTTGIYLMRRYGIQSFDSFGR